MKSRIYKIGDVTLASGERPQVLLAGEPIPPADDYKLRAPDLLVLQYMMVETCKQPKRSFSKEELARAGWPDDAKDKNNNLETIAARIPSTFTRLRYNFVGILPSEGRFLVSDVTDVTPIDPPLVVAHRILIACAITAASVVVFDTAARAILSAMDVTLTQPHFDLTRQAMPLEAQHMHAFGLVLGVFQGILGSLAYSIPVAFCLLYLWFVVFKFDPWTAKFPRTLAVVAGGIGGTIGGVAISFALLFAQHIETLRAAMWVPRWSDARMDAFTITRYGYSMPLFGLFVGGAAGFTVIWVVSRSAWQTFLFNNTSLTNPRVALTVLLGIFKMGTLWSLAFVVPSLAVAACLVCSVVAGPSPFVRAFGEAAVIAVGGVAFVVGMLAAIYSLTKGVDIAGDQKCSLVREV